MTKTLRTSYLLKQTKKYVKAEFQNSEIESLIHRYKNTRNIIKAATKISKPHRLSKIDRFVLIASCWFYDLGYLKDSKNPQQASVEESDKFLKFHKVDKNILEQIKKTLSSVQSQRPDNEVQMILWDAVTSYFGTRKFNSVSRAWRKQEEIDTAEVIPKPEWRKRMIAFLSNHHFFTAYGQQKWDKQKAKNLKKLALKDSKRRSSLTP